MSDLQFTFDDVELSHKLAREGRERAYAATDEAWKVTAFQTAVALIRLRSVGSWFTSEDIQEVVGPAPQSPRAIGGVMTRLAAAGYIKRSYHEDGTRRTVSARRASRHSGSIAVWETLVGKEQK